MDNEMESFIALAKSGGRFLEYGIRSLLGCIRLKKNLKADVCYWLMYSAANRGDWDRVRQCCIDWNGGEMSIANISKFTPGEHYHVLGTKFLSFDAAKDYLESNGYRYGRFIQEMALKEGD